MASARTTREGERRLSLRTLIIASAASATAAIVVSTFWRSGTPIAAAVTPVIVTLVSELLHRPTAAIAERVTVTRDSLPRSARPSGDLPPEARLTRSSREEQAVPKGGPREPARPGERPPPRPAGDGNGEMRVYSGRAAAPPGRRRKFAWRVALITAALAFAIAATVLTVPELLTGGSFGSGGRHTTIFGGSRHKTTTTQDTNTTTTQDQQRTTTQRQQTTPQQSTTKTTPQTTTPKTPRTRRNQTQTAPTTTTPAPKKAPASP